MPTSQERYNQILMERVRGDRYPSHQLLDRIEATFWTPEQMIDYVEMLLDKVDDSWYPSLELLDRIQRMLAMAAMARARARAS
jgi:aspartyl-tRNA synthetase